MANGSTFLDEISTMIAERRKEARIVLERVEEIQQEIRALEQAAGMFRLKHSIDESIDPQELKGKTQMAALIAIARKGNGQFKANEAKRLLVQAGLISNPKNAASIVYTLIKRSERFERVAPGVYRLRNQSQGTLRSIISRRTA